MTESNFRALCAELADALHVHTSLYEGHECELVTRARTTLAQPEPKGVTEEQWDAIKERLWDNYETFGNQGERFMYEGDFYGALDVARQELTRYARPAIEPVPVSERWPEFSDCDSFERVWAFNPVFDHWKLNRINQSIHTHWLPHHALPVPGAEVG